MPQAVPYIYAAAATAGGATAAEVAFVALVISAGVADMQRSSALSRQRRAAEDALRSRNITLRSATAPRTIALGTVRTSGPLMYAEFVGPYLEYLDSIVAINHGELSDLVGVYIGDEYIPASAITTYLPTGGKYAAASLDPSGVEESFSVTAATSVTLGYAPDGGVVGYVILSTGSGESLIQTPIAGTSVAGSVVSWSSGAVTGTVVVGYLSRDAVRPPLRVQWAMGSTSQASTTWGGVASTPKWTSNHRLRGVAYVRTLKLIDHPLYLAGDSGDVGAVIRGPKGVWDPRTSTSLNYTSNPALLAAWYRTLAVADGGMGVPSGWIDWASVSAAANVCDELISVRKLDGSGYENVKRYECHTRLSLDRPPVENLQVILDAMAGDFPYTGGLYKCYAGAFRSATVTLTDDDLVASDPITFAPQAGASVAPPNVVTSTFYDAARNWVQQPARAVTNSTYVTADGAEEILELDLPATTDERQANYLMGVRLERARPSLGGAVTVTGKGANMALLDTVQFSLQGYEALAGKTFEVRRRTNQWNGRYPIELREIKSGTYALDADRFTAAAAVTPPANSMLFDVDALAGVTAAEQLVRQADGTIISRARVTWTAPSQGYVRERGTVRVRWRRAGSDWLYSAAVPGSSLEAFTGPLEDGSMAIIEVQAVNPAGAAGPWTAAAPLPVIGKAAPPSNPASVTATEVPGGVLITWALNTEADYLDTEIRSGASWAAGTLKWRGTADRYLLPWPAAGSLTLWVAHRDMSKNYSATPVSVGLTVGSGSLIGTANIGQDAATKLVSASSAGPHTTSTSICSTNVVADSACKIVVTATATRACTNSSGSTKLRHSSFSIFVFGSIGGGGGSYGTRYHRAEIVNGAFERDAMTTTHTFTGVNAGDDSTFAVAVSGTTLSTIDEEYSDVALEIQVIKR